MKLGGRDEISTFQAIIGLLIIAAICIFLALKFVSQVTFRPLGLLLIVISGICIAGIIVLWQIDLNDTLRQLRSDSDSASPYWNIFSLLRDINILEIKNKSKKEE